MTIIPNALIETEYICRVFDITARGAESNPDKFPALSFEHIPAVVAGFRARLADEKQTANPYDPNTLNWYAWRVSFFLLTNDVKSAIIGS